MTRSLSVGYALLLLCGCQPPSGGADVALPPSDSIRHFLDVAEAVRNNPAFATPTEGPSSTDGGELRAEDIDFLRPLRSQSRTWTEEQKHALSNEVSRAGFKDLNEWIDAGDAALCALTVQTEEVSLDQLQQKLTELEEAARSDEQDRSIAAENAKRLESYREELNFCEAAAERYSEAAQEHAPKIRQFFGLDEEEEPDQQDK